MATLLIIGYVWPEPDSSAAGSRMMQLIELFRAQDWQVTFASPAVPSEHMADLALHGVDKVSIELNDSSFDAFVSRLSPDMVIFDRFMIEEQFGWRVEQHVPDALRILDTEDLHCLREARHRALKGRRELNVADLNSEMAMREVAAILRSDLSLMISSYEIDLLTRHFSVPEQLLHHLPFMLAPVDDANFKLFAQRQGYVVIGNFRHAPNWDAVRHLRNTLWPRIRALQADAQVDVYGAYPPPKATQLDAPKHGFHIRGWAKNARQVMSRARVCLAPLRFGAGLKGKLVEAMICGTPSVTTSIGAEAMHGDLPWNGVVSDDIDGFARGAVGLYHSEKDWVQAQHRGTVIVNSLYMGKDLGEQLVQQVDALRISLQEHRLNNFTGAMLRHHTMKSTKYMAQWIEAKNKRVKAQGGI